MLVKLMILGTLFLLVSCTVDTTLHIFPEIQIEPVYTYTPDAYGDDESVLNNNLHDEEDFFLESCFCGEHFVHEDLRMPTPPLHILELWELGMTPEQFQDFLDQFKNIHRIDYHQFETKHTNYSFVIWTDEPIRDFFFASLDVAGHDWYDGRLVIGTLEVIFEIEELLPGDAVLFSVSFSHYLLPHGGVGFVDYGDTYVRMFIMERMRGGCWPVFILTQLTEDGWAIWN